MSAGAHAGVAKFGLADILDAATELLGDGLHAVADAENRQPEIEQRRRHHRLFAIEGRLGAARQDKTARAKFLDVLKIGIPGVDFAIDARLAHPARDQLSVLRTEIQNQDSIVVQIGHRASHQSVSPAYAAVRRIGILKRAGFTRSRLGGRDDAGHRVIPAHAGISGFD